VAKQGRAQLEQLWSREREQRSASQAQRGEGFSARRRDDEPEDGADSADGTHKGA
jgi:hypothetical protein